MQSSCTDGLAVVGVDLGGEGGDGLDDGEERGLELGRDGGLDPVVEAIGGAGEQSGSGTLHGSAARSGWTIWACSV